MYLTHHYFIDLIGGSIFSYVVFSYTKYMHLPVVNPKMWCRWSYTQIEKIDTFNSDPLLNYGVLPTTGFEDIEMGTVNNNSNNGNSYFRSTGPTAVTTSEPITITPEGTRSRGLSVSSRSGSASDPRPKSGSALNLPSHEEEREDLETISQSSMDNSAVPSVFEGEHYINEQRDISSAASSTLLDEMVETPPASTFTTKNKTPNNKTPNNKSKKSKKH